LTVLATNECAGMLLFDNVLFEVGQADESIRERLLEGPALTSPTSDPPDARRATTVAGLKELLSRQEPPRRGE
jgi:hypothetical protein